jgi:hypothetical protein
MNYFDSDMSKSTNTVVILWLEDGTKHILASKIYFLIILYYTNVYVKGNKN